MNYETRSACTWPRSLTVSRTSCLCYTALAFGVFDGPQIHKRNPRPKTCGFFVSACFVGWLCEYKTRKGNSMGPFLWRPSNHPITLTRPQGDTKMSTTIPLTYRVDYEIGRDAKDLTPIQVEEISAQQSIFYCRCLFYLIRQAAISEPHDPLFNPLLFLHALEQITTLGEALSNAAYHHVESLASLKTSKQTAKKR